MTTLIVSPGVRLAVARSGDGRAELLGQLDVGYGATWYDNTSGSAQSTEGHLRLQLGPALRYWIHPSFAVGGTAGLRYDRLSDNTDGMDHALETTTLFTSLQMTGVF